jgi:hypothetical protein
MSGVTTNVQYVSYLVYNPDDPCSIEQRLTWLKALLDARLPLVLFACPRYRAALEARAAEFLPADHPDLVVVPWHLTDSVTWGRVAAAGEWTPLQLPEARNEKKDTLFFMTLMNAKTELVARVAATTERPYVAFLDAGIAKIFWEPEASFRRLRKLRLREGGLGDLMLLPGCWEPPRLGERPPTEQLARQISWVFCGGFFVVNRGAAERVAAAARNALLGFLMAGRMTWEVNVWVQMLAARPLSFEVAWFKADHDDRMTMIPAQYWAGGAVPPDPQELQEPQDPTPGPPQ